MKKLLRKIRESNVLLDVVDGELKVYTNESSKYDTELIAEIKQKKRELLQFLQNNDQGGFDDFKLSIPLAPAAPHYPLSSSQKRLWVLSQFKEANIAYNVPGMHMFEGDLDHSALAYSFNKLIDRHESLRTIFKEDEQGEVRQYIKAPGETGFAITYHDLLGENKPTEKLKELLQEEVSKPFNLAEGPLVRATLFQVDENKWMLAWVLHHIISDGSSMKTLINELLLFYNAHVWKIPNPLTPLKIQYKDYANWQQQQLTGGSLHGHKKYWLKQFEGELPVLELPADKVRPSVKTYNGGEVARIFGKEITEGIRNLSQEHGGILFMGLLAAVNVLLNKYSGQEDIIIGNPIAGREHVDLENQIGFYLNTLAIRTRFKKEDNFNQLVENVKQIMLGAYEHQAYPFDELVNELQLQPDMSRNALFDVFMALHASKSNNDRDSQGQDGWSVSMYKTGGNIYSRFDLTFDFFETEEEIKLILRYNSDIYSSSTVAGMAENLERLLQAVIVSSNIAINKLDYLGDAEKHRQLVLFNNNVAAYPVNKTIAELFQEQVKKTPDNIALVFEEKELSYEELNRLSNQLAGYLRMEYKIRANDLIGMKLERSEWLIIAMLGILKSGAAYVPFDPEYPQERINFMIADSHCKVVIDENELAAFIEKKEQIDSENLPSVSGPDDLMYLIYTSGSTGQPKGAMTKQGQYINLICWYKRILKVQPDDCTLMMAPVSFDLAHKNIYVALLFGAKLCVPEKLYGDYQSLADTIAKQQVTIINCAPSAFYPLLDVAANTGYQKISSVKKIAFGGEPVSINELLGWVRSGWYNAEIINTYGPTECTDIVSSYTVSNHEWDTLKKIPIGISGDNMGLYILDADHNLVPTGAAGEIFIAGVCVGLGYLNQPELTAQKFVPNPFVEMEKMYKTGDIGRRLPDGNIEFMGRRDDQVKIRGNRIELGEIESALLNYPGIDSAVALIRTDKNGEKELIAYIVSKETVHAQDLRAGLYRILPAYMLPDHFVQLEAMPLNPSGKINKKALEKLEQHRLPTGVEYIAPRDETEEKLVAIWKNILNTGNERISVKDNFFERGGNSLRATRLASHIYKAFGIKLELLDLFSRLVLEEQARLIVQAKKTSFIAISPVETKPYYELSSAQKRLWVLGQFEQANIAYNIPRVHVFEGELNEAALSAAFNTLMERHEILRTVFRANEKGEIKQFICKPVETGFHIICHDLRGENNHEEVLKSLVGKEFVTPFDLDAGPLLRASLYQVADDKWVFAYVMHHIISDGWSMEILIKELLLLYNVYDRGEENPLVPLRIQYKDYAAWQQQQLTGERLQEHKTYWLKQFEGEVPVLELQGDKLRPAIKTYNGSVVTMMLDAGISKGIKNLCKEHQSTLFMGLLAVVNALLYRYTNQDDIIIGTPLAGREHVDLEDQIGFYINTLALRTRFKGENSFRELLAKVREVALGAYKHQIYPFDELVNELHLQRDISRHPLFDIQVIVQNSATGDNKKPEEPGKLNIGQYAETDIMTSVFDIVFTFAETKDGLRLEMIYNNDIYRKAQLKHLGDHLERMLAAIIDHPDIPVAELEFLGEKEKRRLLYEFNDTTVNFPQGKTLPGLFEQQVLQIPGNTAVVFEQTTLSYKELEEKSNRLANYLLSNYTIRPGDLIGIMMDRSEKLLIAILGILKTGAAYVPIDIEYPRARKKYILKDAGIKILLTNANNIFDLDYYDGDILIDVSLDTLTDSTGSCGVVVNSEDLAYVIYTSGSTGEPKGVMITHASIVNTIYGQPQVFGTLRNKRGLQFSSPSFDSSVWEIFLMIAHGGVLYIIGEGAKKTPSHLEKYITENKIDIATIPPAYLKMLRVENIKTLGNLLTAGEAASYEESVSFLQYGNCFNGYGPTESSVCTSIFPLSKERKIENKNIPIGRPSANTRVYIVNDQLKLMPQGTIGEICIAGQGLARGYLNQPELTQMKFVRNPFVAGDRMYRTGDLGRWLADGNLEFTGRKDEQVKIRGYRIELGEIGAAVQSLPDIESAVVAVRSGEGNKELVAYMVSKRELNIRDIRSGLSRSLPSYMIPAHFVQLDELPLTTNGKVDRKALPDPQEISMSFGTTYVAPRNETEEKLIKIWEKILEKEQIGIKDGFFELGGDSIKILRMLAEFEKEFNLQVPIADIYKNDTIEQITDHIFQNKDKIEQQNETAKEISSVVRKQIEELKERILLSDRTLQKDNIEDIYPMSDIEKGMIFESLASEGMGIYHNQLVLRGIFSDFDIERFRLAALLIVENNSILRTAFNISDYEKEVQIVYKKIDLNIRYEDITGKSSSEQEQAVFNFITEERKNPFDFTAAPLWRIDAFNWGKGNIIFIFQCHHAILDGWSDALFVTEMNNLYLELAEDPFYRPKPLKSGYKDFIIQHETEKSDESIMRFWKQELSGCGRLDLFTEEEEVQIDSRQFDEISFKKVEKLALDLNTTVKVISLSAYLYMLKVLDYGSEIVTGFVTNTRPSREDSDKILGCFLNTIPFKMQPNGNESCAAYIARVHDKLIALKDYERLSILEMSRQLGKQSKQGNPFFDVIFDYVDFYVYKLTKNQDSVQEQEAIEQTLAAKMYGFARTNTYMDFIIERTGGGYHINLRLRRKLRSGFSVAKVIDLYVSILDHFIEGTVKPVGEAGYISGEERFRLLETFNDTAVTYSPGKTLLDMFGQQVKNTPAATAVKFGEIVLSYKELDEKSNQLANFLQKMYKVEVNDLIGIMLDRSEKTVIAILGILKSGAAYVPVDPEYPAARKEYIINDTKLRVLITQADYIFDLAYYQGEIFAIDIQSDTIDTLTDAPVVQILPGDLAYVIYTSGSTGNPKGCPITRRNLLNYIQWANSYYFKEPGQANFGLFTSLSFDLTVTSIFCTLTQGGLLTIYNQRAELATILQHSFSKESGITSIKLTPSHINLLNHLAIKPSAMQRAIVGGEEVTVHHVQVLKKINPSIEIYNEYGPAEATVGCIVKQLEENTPVLIGRPIANTQIYIINDHHGLAPIGIKGEICVGGDSLSKGYLNNPELSAGKFIHNPFGKEGNIYKTGDLGRWLENGEIEFFGRKDEQVKIKGYRIELGEIEKAIQSDPRIKSAVVIARSGNEEEKQLVAYLSSDETTDESGMRAHLGKLLPAYMIPAHFVQLEQLPLTANGKVDKKALPDPGGLGIATGITYIPPRNETEGKIVAIWEKVLGREKLGIRNGFFESGGDSIRVLRMLSELKNDLDIEVSISDAYKYTTIEKLVNHVLENKVAIRERNKKIRETEAIVKEEIRQLKERILSSPGFPEDTIEDIYPMSDIEKGMVFESLVNEEFNVYHDQMVRQRVMVDFDIEIFRLAVSLLAEKHPILRTSFNLVDYETEVQIIHKKIDDTVLYRDISLASWPEQEATVREFIRSELENPFDFSKAPLWRICIFRCTKDEIILVFQCHHSVIDGWSDTLLMTELNNLYLALKEDPSYRPAPIQASYKDCIIQHEVEKRDESIRKFWKEELMDYTRLDLFTEQEDSRIHLYPVDALMVNKLEEAAGILNTTVKVISLSAYLYMLKALSNEREVVAGLLTNIRPNCIDSDKILGCFLNTIPLKMPVNGSMTCAEFVSHVHDKVIELKDKERLSLLDISLIHNKQLNFGNPFFDVLFNYVDFHEYTAIKNHASASQHEATTPASDIFGNLRGNTHFDFLIDRTLGAYKVILVLTKKLKSGLSPESITELYLHILDHIISFPLRPMHEVEYTNAKQREKLMLKFNDTTVEHPAHRTIIDLFYDQAGKTPDDIAIVAEGTALTYKELNERSNQLAGYLKQNYDIQKDSLVGIKLERSEWTVIAILAVMKSGAAYLPMDPQYPKSRIDYMVEDSGCVTVLDEETLAVFKKKQDEYLENDSVRIGLPADLAYVIYTSGSTGKPKGVMISHANIVNFFSGLSERLPVDQDDCMLAVTSISFDISVLELLWTLCNGVQVVIHSSENALSTLDRYVADEDLALDFSLFFFSSYNNEVKEKYNLLLESAKYADAEGFKAIWVPERHFHEFGGLYPNPSVISSALAMITKKVELRSGSVVSPLHDEIRIAEEWSVVDNLSGGRVGLSFAAGWNQNDFALSKYEYKERQQVMHRQIETVKKLWKGGSIIRKNGIGNDAELRIFPKPVQKEIPVWITSSGNPETFISAGAMGANLLTHFLGQDMQDLSNKIKLYRQARRKNGHDEKSGKVTVMLHTFVGTDINEIERIVELPFIEYLKSSIGVSRISLEEAGIREEDLSEDVKEKILKNAFRRYYKTSSLIGTAGSCSTILKNLKEIGVDEVACLVDFGVEEGVVLENLKNLKKLKTLFSKKEKRLHRPITMMQSTPSFMKLLEEDKASAMFLQSLRSLLIGGEALPLSLLKTIRKNYTADIYNMYGPTETTIWSCMHRFEENPSEVLIGKPMMNTQVYILGEDMQIMPVGIAGDMYIGGKGIARGYLNKPVLSGEMFIAHPFRKGERLYKTGDVARWLADGTIEFIGRRDEQVKIRGHRVEPVEIENVLQDYPGIESAVVIARVNQETGKELIAYLTGTQKLNTSDIRGYLTRMLPAFMVPEYFVQLDGLPLTSNGKIDRKRLPDPEKSDMDTGVEYVAPRNKTEKKLVLVWQEVLGREKIGIQDDYFELGGNSLKAMRVIKRVLDETGFSVPLTVLFTERNVENMAAYIDKNNNQDNVVTPGKNSSENNYLADVSYNQLVYFSEWYTKEMDVVVSTQEYRDVDMDAFRLTVNQLIQRHEILRTVFINADGAIKQKILSMEELNFEIDDPVMVTSENQMAEIIEKAYRIKFDLSVAPLIHVKIYKQKKGNYAVLTVMHHILSDGYSANVAKNELPLLYAANVRKTVQQLPPLPFQYRDFSAWQRSFVNSAEGTVHRNYWLKKLKGFDPAIKLPYSPLIAGNKQANIIGVIKTIDGAFFDEVDRFIRRNSLTHAGLLMGALILLLNRLSGQEDITICTQASGRDSKYYGKLDVTGLMGNFTNLLLVRNNINKKQTAIEYLQHVQRNFLDDLSFDAYPIDHLVSELPGIKQSVFLQSTVLFNYHNYSYLKEIIAETGEKEEESRTRGDMPMQQAFVLGVSEYKNCLSLIFAFSNSIVDRTTREEIRDIYFSILKQIVYDPHVLIATISENKEKEIEFV